jgi:hypothetical protein
VQSDQLGNGWYSQNRILESKIKNNDKNLRIVVTKNVLMLLALIAITMKNKIRR